MSRWSEWPPEKRAAHSARVVERRKERLAAMSDAELERYKEARRIQNHRYYLKRRAAK